MFMLSDVLIKQNHCHPLKPSAWQILPQFIVLKKGEKLTLSRQLKAKSVIAASLTVLVSKSGHYIIKIINNLLLLYSNCYWLNFFHVQLAIIKLKIRLLQIWLYLLKKGYCHAKFIDKKLFFIIIVVALLIIQPPIAHSKVKKCYWKVKISIYY